MSEPLKEGDWVVVTEPRLVDYFNRVFRVLVAHPSGNIDVKCPILEGEPTPLFKNEIHKLPPRDYVEGSIYQPPTRHPEQLFPEKAAEDIFPPFKVGDYVRAKTAYTERVGRIHHIFSPDHKYPYCVGDYSFSANELTKLLEEDVLKTPPSALPLPLPHIEVGDTVELDLGTGVQGMGIVVEIVDISLPYGVREPNGQVTYFQYGELRLVKKRGEKSPEQKSPEENVPEQKSPELKVGDIVYRKDEPQIFGTVKDLGTRGCHVIVYWGAGHRGHHSPTSLVPVELEVGDEVLITTEKESFTGTIDSIDLLTHYPYRVRILGDNFFRATKEEITLVRKKCCGGKCEKKVQEPAHDTQKEQSTQWPPAWEAEDGTEVGIPVERKFEGPITLQQAFNRIKSELENNPQYYQAWEEKLKDFCHSPERTMKVVWGLESRVYDDPPTFEDFHH